MRRLALLLLPLLALSACKRANMVQQERSQTWDRNSFFANNASMRHAPPGTVARDEVNPEVPPPATIDAATMARGHERFDIFCTPCHGRTGNGEGMIVQRGFTHPPSFVQGPLRQAKADVFYDTITNGHGAMYSYADRVPSADRWAIIAYIRALQLSQDAQVSALPASDQARLAAVDAPK